MKFFSPNNGLGLHMYSLLFALLLFPALARAHAAPLGGIASFQQQAISGIVSDAQGPIPGVTISVKGTSVAVVSDDNGKYSISAQPSDVLVFSFIGYKSQEVVAGTRSVINIKLTEDVTTLQEVTVNAGYYSVTEKERTGSISRITSKDIEKQPVTNVLATMQGRMAGVNITQTTGTPGGGFEIEIRGQNSLRSGGNRPLYIIDGVPYASDPIGSGMNSPILPSQPSPLNSINPEQIESIEVLKDADATAIYGSRGANGVVLITTKRGREGKTRFSASLSQGVGQVARFMNLMKTPQYIAMREEAYANDCIAIPETAYDINGTWDRNRYTDWQKELIGGSAEITDMQASLSGGSAQTQFLLSGNYNKQTTVFPGDFNYHKGNVRLNVNHESENKRFRSNFTVGYTLQDNNQPRTGLSREAVTLAPNAPALYNPDGTLNWENSTFNNPLRYLGGKYLSSTTDLIFSGSVGYQLGHGLELKSSFGYTALENGETTTEPSTQFDPSYGVGPEVSTLTVSATDRKSWIAEPQLSWNREIGKGKIDVLLGSTFQAQKGSQLVQYAYGFSSNSLISNLASASTVLILNSDESEYRYQALFGRINYNYADRYILNLTGRRDGSSRFGPGKQFASFGAVGAAWLFSNEAFFEKNKILSFGKLRASYGITGNDQIGDYQYINTYASSGVSYGSTVGLQPTRLFNPDFGWETNRKFEVALEAGFLQDRIFLTAGLYDNRSSNQLTGIPLPGTTGFSSLQANLDATVQNRGVELTLRTANIRNDTFSWTTSINFTMAKNKLLEYPDLEGSTYANQYVIGKPLNIQKVYRFTGVDPQTGVYTYADINGDGQLTAAEDKTTVRDFNPKYFGGLQNSLRYKSWSLDFLFQFVKQINYNASAYLGLPGAQGNQTTDVLNHWQQPGDAAPYQVYTDGANSAAVEAYYKYFESDAAISDASYIRLKNIALSYELPLQGMQCRVFFEGQNVLTFTNYKGPDPEFKSIGFLPPLRVLSLGVQLSF
jgi:TonB-linked SusC/RagA family outer membrane protein